MSSREWSAGSKVRCLRWNLFPVNRNANIHPTAARQQSAASQWGVRLRVVNDSFAETVPPWLMSQIFECRRGASSVVLVAQGVMTRLREQTHGSLDDKDDNNSIDDEPSARSVGIQFVSGAR